MGVDLVIVPVALLLTLALQFNTIAPFRALPDVWLILPFLVVTAAVVSLALGIPRIRLKSYELRAVGKTAIFAILMGVTSAALAELAKLELPVGSHVIFAITFFLLSAASRVAMLQLYMWLLRRARPRCRVVIYGAGTTGMQLASALKNHQAIDPIAFVDDAPALQGMTVSGLPVCSPRDLRQIIKDRRVDRVLLAMPSLSQPKQTQIARRVAELGAEVQALPSFSQLIGEEALLDKLTPILPSALLGRDHLDEDLSGGCESYTGRTVLVSGAGGTIGSELCRQVLACKPGRLVLYELSELALYTIHQELGHLVGNNGPEIVPVLGSVTDQRLVRKVLADQGVQVILHAAAYKHVPLVESNPLSGLANNVLGTRTLARAAEEAGVERFILISSDKAVRPANIMGASKRLAELTLHDLANRAKGTVFAMVRFGNVLGSSGSVIPLFQEQIARGGPVTLTHKDVTRYFMTVQEAARLVLRAGTFAQGGEIFVLDMGEPVSIRKLARQVIEASGYTVRDADTPDGDIEIVTTGLRPGEKLYEELMIGEGMLTTPHPKILCAGDKGLSEIEVARALRELRAAVAAADEDAARAVAERWVEGFGGGRAPVGQKVP